jgi:hypothetical protein
MQTIIIGNTEYHWAEGDRGLCLQKAIQVGATKTQNGKTYVFNENKRWTIKREPKAAKPAKAPEAPKQLKPKALKPPTKKLLKLREQSEAMGAKVGPQRLTELRRESTSEEHLHQMLKQETGGMRKLKPKAEAKPKAPKVSTPDGMAALISNIDRELGTDNYVPIYEIVKRSGLPKDQVVKTLYALQKTDRIELGGLQEQKNYTPEQIEMGSIEQPSVGGNPLPPMFFVTLNEQQPPPKSKKELKPKAMPADLAQMRSEVLAQPLTPKKPDAVTPAVKPKVAPKPTATPPVKPPSSPKVTPRKATQRRSLQPKAPTPPPAPIAVQIESHPEIQTAAKRVGAIARAMESVKSLGENNPAIAKLKAQAQANPGAVEDIAVAAIAMAGQFALMPQADLATAALMQGAIGVATRAGARTGKRVREEMKADPNTLKSLQGVIKLGRGILSDLMSQETQEKMIGDAIGPTLAAGTGAAVGGGLAGAVAGTGAAVGGAPRAAAAIRQVAASKLRPKAAPKQLRPKAA